MNMYKSKKVAVLGLGIEGRDAVSYLLSIGAIVTLFDKKNESDLDFSGVDKNRIQIICGENYLDNGLNNFDFVVRSPGIYRYIPQIVEAEKNAVIITSSTKIFFEKCPGKIIGVTGTKGKGTTSTLIYEIMKSAGFSVYLSGNIGKPYLELLPKLNKNSWVIMEMSSFQLIDLDISPHIAVVLNITEDHLDWHKDKEEYINAKKNINSHQTTSDYMVVNYDYEISKNFDKNGSANLIGFSKSSLDTKFKENLLLRGEHNLENVAASVSVAKILKIDDPIILKVLATFKGLEHRLELVGEVNGTTFYNDSFATGPQSTVAAIRSFSEPETLIIGGSDKGLDYSELRNEIEKRENLINVITIGAIGQDIVKGVENKNIINLGTSSMNRIIEVALEVTPKGGVVILSPAAASFDMFLNYKERGNKFKESVKKLQK